MQKGINTSYPYRELESLPLSGNLYRFYREAENGSLYRGGKVTPIENGSPLGRDWESLYI